MWRSSRTPQRLRADESLRLRRGCSLAPASWMPRVRHGSPARTRVVADEGSGGVARCKYMLPSPTAHCALDTSPSALAATVPHRSCPPHGGVFYLLPCRRLQTPNLSPSRAEERVEGARGEGEGRWHGPSEERSA